MANLLLMLAVCSGCARQEVPPPERSSVLEKPARRLKVERIAGSPRAPSKPYADDPQLRAAYVAGYKRGWELGMILLINGGAGTVGAPWNLLKPPQVQHAWLDGYHAAYSAVYERCRKHLFEGK